MKHNLKPFAFKIPYFKARHTHTPSIHIDICLSVHYWVTQVYSGEKEQRAERRKLLRGKIHKGLSRLGKREKANGVG